MPPNATSYGLYYIGTSAVPAAGMEIAVWGGEIGESKIKLRLSTVTCSYVDTRYEVVVTANACIPVTDTLFSIEGDRFIERVSE